MDQRRIILIAGIGRLPDVIADRVVATGTPLTVLSLPGARQTWPAGIEAEAIALDNCMRVLSDKRAEGWTHVVMAGGTSRPTARQGTAQTLPIDFSGGDDAVLRQFITYMEDGLHLSIIGADDIAPELVTHSGCLTSSRPQKADMADIEHGFHLARDHGMNDAGQAAVVAGLDCIALEPPGGTDALLMQVATKLAWSGDPTERKGVLVKCRKPTQDRRIDLPTVGVNTVAMAASAGLAGIAIESGEVILLDQDRTVTAADRHGLYIWSGEITP